MISRMLREARRRLSNFVTGFRFPTRLWIDEDLPAPRGWYWATTAEEAQEVLEDHLVEETSFSGDVDLAYDVVRWLVDHEKLGFCFWPGRVSLHAGKGQQALEAVGFLLTRRAPDRYRKAG